MDIHLLVVVDSSYSLEQYYCGSCSFQILIWAAGLVSSLSVTLDVLCCLAEALRFCGIVFFGSCSFWFLLRPSLSLGHCDQFLFESSIFFVLFQSKSRFKGEPTSHLGLQQDNTNVTVCLVCTLVSSITTLPGLFTLFFSFP